MCVPTELSCEQRQNAADPRRLLNLITDVDFTELFKKAEKSEFQFIAAALW